MLHMFYFLYNKLLLCNMSCVLILLLVLKYLLFMSRILDIFSTDSKASSAQCVFGYCVLLCWLSCWLLCWIFVIDSVLFFLRGPVLHTLLWEPIRIYSLTWWTPLPFIFFCCSQSTTQTSTMFVLSLFQFLNNWQLELSLIRRRTAAASVNSILIIYISSSFVIELRSSCSASTKTCTVWSLTGNSANSIASTAAHIAASTQIHQVIQHEKKHRVLLALYQNAVLGLFILAELAHWLH